VKNRHGARWFYCFYNLCAPEPVRIRRSEIEKLAFQAESVRIFAESEIPGGANRMGAFVWRRHPVVKNRHGARWFYCFYNLCAPEPVRIRRSEIEKLAFQAESVRIFAESEIPGGVNRMGVFLWRRHPVVKNRHGARRFYCFYNLCAPEPVRIRRSEIEKLAFQAESVRIFAESEIPGGGKSIRPHKRADAFTFSLFTLHSSLFTLKMAFRRGEKHFCFKYKIDCRI